MAHWTRVSKQLPPEGEVVDTISPSGMQQKLKRRGQLWFAPDDSIYVYYTPTLWMPISGAAAGRSRSPRADAG